MYFIIQMTNCLVNGLVPVGQQTIHFINQHWPKVNDAIFQIQIGLLSQVTVRDSLHKVIHFNTNDQFDVSGHEYFDA